jgi:hypothetical protein
VLVMKAIEAQGLAFVAVHATRGLVAGDRRLGCDAEFSHRFQPRKAGLFISHQKN